MMGVGAVVKRFELLGARIDLAEVEVARLLRQRAAPPAGRVARLREGQRLERGEAGLAHLAAHFLDQIQQHQRRLRLLHQDAVVLQRAEAAFVEGPVEQALGRADRIRSEEHTSELQSLMRISYAVFCLKKKKKIQHETISNRQYTRITLTITQY